jgi:hypothetical protein
MTGDTPMRTDRVIDEIRQQRTARYERLGDSAQAWRPDIVSQRLALEAQGWVQRKLRKARCKTTRECTLSANLR